VFDTDSETLISSVILHQALLI